MRYRVYHVFSCDKTELKERRGYILIDMQDLLIEPLNGDEGFYLIPRKRITFKIIRALTKLPCSRELAKEYLDYMIKGSALVTKEYELLPHNSSK